MFEKGVMGMLSKLPPNLLLSALKPTLPAIEELAANGSHTFNITQNVETVFTLKAEYDDDELPLTERKFKRRMMVQFSRIENGELVPYKALYFADFLGQLFSGLSEKETTKTIAN